MPDYRRYRVPGGTYFFTINLLERRSDLLIRHIEALREAVRRTRAERSFHITAGWFCRITSIACSPCQPVTMTFPTASKPSRSGSTGGGTERAALIGAYSPRRTGDMATSFLGTRPSRRRRLCAPHGLCTLQFSQTWPCYAVAQWPYSTFHRWVKAGVYPVGWGGDGVTD